MDSTRLGGYRGIRIADWRDIVAEKIKTIAQRGSKKDFLEVYSAIVSNRFSIEETVVLFRSRFESTNLNLYHVLRSLAYFEDADKEPIRCRRKVKCSSGKR